jgi:hypothetical protein
MNHVTKTTPSNSEADKGKPNQPGLIRFPPELKQKTSQPSIEEVDHETPRDASNHMTTIREHDNGFPGNDHTSGSVLMGKLCRRALALIKHKVGADGSVSDRMAQALATWLRQWGITIYTESEL